MELRTEVLRIIWDVRIEERLYSRTVHEILKETPRSLKAQEKRPDPVTEGDVPYLPDDSAERARAGCGRADQDRVDYFPRRLKRPSIRGLAWTFNRPARYNIDLRGS